MYILYIAEDKLEQVKIKKKKNSTTKSTKKKQNKKQNRIKKENDSPS